MAQVLGWPWEARFFINRFNVVSTKVRIAAVFTAAFFFLRVGAGAAAVPNWLTFAGFHHSQTSTPSVSIFSDVSIDYTSPEVQSGGSTTTLRYFNRIGGVTIDARLSQLSYASRSQLSDELEKDEAEIDSRIREMEIGLGIDFSGIRWSPGVVVTSCDDGQLILPQMDARWSITPEFGVGGYYRSTAMPVTIQYHSKNDSSYRYHYLPELKSFGATVSGEVASVRLDVEGGATVLASSSGPSTLETQASGYGYRGRAQWMTTSWGDFVVMGDYVTLRDGEGSVRNNEGQLQAELEFDDILVQRLGFEHQLSGWKWGIDDITLESRGVAIQTVSTIGGAWSDSIGRLFYRTDRIVFANQRLNFWVGSESDTSMRLSVGRLALTGNIKNYDMPLFFLYYGPVAKCPKNPVI